MVAAVACEESGLGDAVGPPVNSPVPTSAPLPTPTVFHSVMPTSAPPPTPTVFPVLAPTSAPLPTPTVLPTPVPTAPPPPTPTFAELNQQLLTREEWNQHLITWEQASVPDYQIIYHDIGGSRQGNTEPVIITVRNLAVTSVANQTDGQPAPERSYPTVAQLFGLVSEALSGQHRIEKVTFDPDLGYPTSVSLASDQPGEPQTGFTAKVHLDSTGSQRAIHGASPEALAVIEALYWVRDGLTPNERSAASALGTLANVSRQAFEGLMAKRWMVEDVDAPTGIESRVIRGLAAIVRRDRALAEQLVLMPFLNTLESGDWYLLDTLAKLLDMDPEAADHVLSLPILMDGVSDDLATEIPLQYLALRDPDAAQAVRTLPWIQDGVPPDARGDLKWEVKAVGELQFLAVNAPEAFWSLMDRPWMGTEQGKTAEKARVIGAVVEIARLDQEAAGQVAALPFLASLETPKTCGCCKPSAGSLQPTQKGCGRRFRARRLPAEQAPIHG